MLWWLRSAVKNWKWNFRGTVYNELKLRLPCAPSRVLSQRHTIPCRDDPRAVGHLVGDGLSPSYGRKFCTWPSTCDLEGSNLTPAQLLSILATLEADGKEAKEKEDLDKNK